MSTSTTDFDPSIPLTNTTDSFVVVVPVYVWLVPVVIEAVLLIATAVVAFWLHKNSSRLFHFESRGPSEIELQTRQEYYRQEEEFARQPKRMKLLKTVSELENEKRESQPTNEGSEKATPEEEKTPTENIKKTT